MTTFEFFKQQYDKNHDLMVECINKEIEVDSLRFVKIAAKFAFGGTTNVDPWFNIIGVEDTKEMRDLGYVKAWDGYSDRKRHITLTAKGITTFYKKMF